MTLLPVTFLTALALLFSVSFARIASAEPRHGLSVFGELKYPADFQHFDYVNADAPKGGRMVTMGTGGANTFDTLNQFILKGDAAQGLDLLFDALMVRAQDEPDAVYGLVAKSADVAPDGMSVTFKLRPEAKFSDGSPLTAEDVVFSFGILKEKGHPAISMTLRDVVSAEALDKETVRYTFKGTLVRDLPITVAQLPVLSKAYYATQPFEETSLKPPLGSGPYKIKSFNPGTDITYTRREDYWAKDLPVNRGRYNLDEIRYDYYRDRNIELEAVKSGNMDLREEFSSISWATGYNIPAVTEGRLVKVSLPDDRPSGAQGYFLNTRRDKFKDPRVRQALDLVFDFEWSNKKLFYGLYKRTTSYFENSDMKATGKPSPEELALLEPYKDKLASEVFDEPYTPPVTDGSGNNRDNLKKARDLLIAAGWKPGSDNFLHNDKGERLTIEFLDFEAMFERITVPYTENLKRIGVDASWRLVDPAQYERRVKAFDFDIATQRYSLRLTPGIEMRSYWGSEAAKTDGSFNLAGISDPVIDALVDKVVAAKSRAELVTATRSIDRVLRAGHYWVPHWYKASYGIAYWNKYARPAVQPKYDAGILDTWWYDPAKAAALSSGKPTAQTQEQPAKP
ncbi:extracellular solute-binding protein [Hyphomicrobium sp.]|uniref:extracellular solute-binding protein n=1 Tax=Hyphomicrobium sp. TaxID=82 RepID=UPI001DE2C070|nr:extracellular solute-binding protein [Hyphomicrobium sp.]MBY0560895.1 extracellular solute-binding protein [Hyphomicrobium sp.]